MTWPQDRAAVVARAIRRILTDIKDPAEQDRQIENLLRDQFHEVQQQTIADFPRTDD